MCQVSRVEFYQSPTQQEMKTVVKHVTFLHYFIGDNNVNS